MSGSKNDPFLEKIKQYSIDELTLAENNGGIGAGSVIDPNNRKGAFSSLLLPHEWLQLDNSYVGAPPSLPAEEYKSILEVGFVFIHYY